MNQRPEPTMRELIENVVEDLMLLLDEIDGDGDCDERAPFQFADSDAPAP